MYGRSYDAVATLRKRWRDTFFALQRDNQPALVAISKAQLGGVVCEQWDQLISEFFGRGILPDPTRGGDDKATVINMLAAANVLPFYQDPDATGSVHDMNKEEDLQARTFLGMTRVIHSFGLNGTAIHLHFPSDKMLARLYVDYPKQAYKERGLGKNPYALYDGFLAEGIKTTRGVLYMNELSCDAVVVRHKQRIFIVMARADDIWPDNGPLTFKTSSISNILLASTDYRRHAELNEHLQAIEVLNQGARAVFAAIAIDISTPATPQGDVWVAANRRLDGVHLYYKTPIPTIEGKGSALFDTLWNFVGLSVGGQTTLASILNRLLNALPPPVLATAPVPTIDSMVVDAPIKGRMPTMSATDAMLVDAPSSISPIRALMIKARVNSVDAACAIFAAHGYTDDRFEDDMLELSQEALARLGFLQVDVGRLLKAIREKGKKA